MANITANLYWIYILRVKKVKACTLEFCFSRHGSHFAKGSGQRISCCAVYGRVIVTMHGPREY